MIDTHAHIDGEEFQDDFLQVIDDAKSQGVEKIFIPNVNLESIKSVDKICRQFPDFLFPMIGLHPEDANPQNVDVDKALGVIYDLLKKDANSEHKYIAVGEVGLDFYWDQSYNDVQIYAFEKQIQMAVEFNLPIMIHSRNAQKELVKVIANYDGKVRGVFHCFSGNEEEAKQLLNFNGFVLGIGGILTFKKSILPNTLKNTVPLDRIVLETDSPYMAPVPMRGKRNQPAFVRFVAQKLAEVYDTDINTVESVTNNNVKRIFS